MNHVDIVGMHNRKVPSCNESRNRLNNSVEYYLDITRKLISTIGSRYSQRLVGHILKNDDAVSNIATQVMFADWRWNGKGTLEGYRVQCAKWAILLYIHRHANRKHNLSLDQIRTEDNNSLAEILQDKHTNSPVYILEEKEQTEENEYMVKQLFEHTTLTPRQERCIQMYYLEDKSIIQIAQHLKLSKQAVQESLRYGIKNVQNTATKLQLSL